MGLLFSQVSNLFQPYENMALQDLIDAVTNNVNQLMRSEDDSDDIYSEYRSKAIRGATEFLMRYNGIAQAHGLTINLEKDKAVTPFDMARAILDVKGWRLNGCGFPVTWQQRVIAELALERTQSNYDFIILVVGKRGRGKSTFTTELGSTFLELQGRPFGLDNLVLTEQREAIFETTKKWLPGEFHMFDEAINQLFSRDFFKSGDFISLLTEIRYKRAFAAFLIPELFQIDKIVREGLADMVFTTTERGMAIMQAPSLLSGSDRYMMKKPTEPILTPKAHTDYMMKGSLNTLGVVPFMEITGENAFWKLYENIKDKKISAREFQTKISSHKGRSNELYLKLAIEIYTNHPDMSRLSEGYVDSFAERVNYAVSAEGFAKWLALNLGIRKNDLIIDDTNGMSIDLSNRLIQSYLKKLTALANGDEVKQ